MEFLQNLSEIKNPETLAESGFYDVAGVLPVPLLQITLLLVPLLLEQPQRPSSSYDE